MARFHDAVGFNWWPWECSLICTVNMPIPVNYVSVKVHRLHRYISKCSTLICMCTLGWAGCHTHALEKMLCSIHVRYEPWSWNHFCSQLLSILIYPSFPRYSRLVGGWPSTAVKPPNATICIRTVLMWTRSIWASSEGGRSRRKSWRTRESRWTLWINMWIKLGNGDTKETGVFGAVSSGLSWSFLFSCLFEWNCTIKDFGR